MFRVDLLHPRLISFACHDRLDASKLNRNLGTPF